MWSVARVPKNPRRASFADQMVASLSMTSDRLIRQAAIRAEQDRTRVGYVLASYRDARGWTRQQLADWLADGDDISTALICSEPLATRQPIFFLAERYGVNPDRLAMILVGYSGSGDV
jgi:hypothetical protein